MRGAEGKNAAAAAALEEWAARKRPALQRLGLDVTDDASVERAVVHVLAAAGGIDVPNAGVACVGPTEC